MEDASFLFAGIKFDRKKFAKDFERFKEKKENKDLGFELSIVGNAKSEQEEGDKSLKKRKWKGVTGGSVEGFSVFKSSNPTSEIDQNDVAEDESSEKEAFRQLEWDNILRKKYGIHVSGSNVPSPLQSFHELKTRYKCKSYLLRNFAELGYVEPTPIQRQAIPVLLSGREFFACAPTGSGKTLAFVCPILMMLKHGLKNGIRAVVLCPTRELAAQTTRECKKLAEGKKFYIKLMTKELARSADYSKLRCDLLVSTPLCLEFAIRKRKLDLSRVEFLVLDESDKLFELGFVEQIDFVVKACSNPSVVRSLFSATLPDTVEDLACTFMHDALRIIVGRKNTASQTIKQKLVFAGGEEGKLIALRQNFAERLDPPVLIFVQSIERAKELYKELALTDIRVDVIHSHLPEAQRENAINDFRAGKTWVLIATDVAAQGRSGRAGREGEAITFYTEEDIPYLRNIANVMTQSGCEVPTWIMSMPKAKWKKHHPKRDSITSGPRDDE